MGNDVAAVSDAVREMLPAFTRALLLVGLTGIGLAALDWRLAVAAAVALPIHVIGLRWYLRNVVPVYRRERIAEGVRTEQLLTAIAGAKTARTLGLGAARLEDVRASSADAADIAMHAARLQGTRFLPALNGAELVGLTRCSPRATGSSPTARSPSAPRPPPRCTSIAPSTRSGSCCSSSTNCRTR